MFALRRPCMFSQVRFAASDIRPKKSKFKKAFKGTYPSRSGGSLRGTTVFLGDYGLQTLDGGRITDLHLDTARTGLRRVLKNEKGSEWFMRCFPDRPVSAKPGETRMGKGKGYVDHYATWLSPGRMIFEVGKARGEVAKKALEVAGMFVPFRTRVVEAGERVGARCLPGFVRMRVGGIERADAIAALPVSTGIK